MNDFVEQTSEILEQMRGAFGDAVMDQALKEMADETQMARRMIMLDQARVAKAARERSGQALERTGLRPGYEPPLMDWLYWGLRVGFECWDDQEFVAEYQRDNPETVVHLQKRENRIVHPGFEALGSDRPARTVIFDAAGAVASAGGAAA